MAGLNGIVPAVAPIEFVCVTASPDLPVYPNGYAFYGICQCTVREAGRTMMDSQWVRICMRCGCLERKKNNFVGEKK
jgi:hypothetical protein